VSAQGATAPVRQPIPLAECRFSSRVGRRPNRGLASGLGFNHRAGSTVLGLDLQEVATRQQVKRPGFHVGSIIWMPQSPGHQPNLTNPRGRRAKLPQARRVAFLRHRGYISAEAAPATSRRAPMATYSRKAQAGKGMRRKGTSGYSTFGFIGGGLIGSRIVRGTLGLCRRPPNRLCQRHIRVPGFGVLDDGLSGPGGGGRGVRCRREGGSGAALTPRRSPALTGQAPRRTGVGVPFGAQDAAVPTSRVPSVEGG